MWQILCKKSFAEAVFTQRAAFNSKVYILAPGVEYICNVLFAFKFHKSSDIYTHDAHFNVASSVEGGKIWTLVFVPRE